jgi:hypothetical protein
MPLSAPQRRATGYLAAYVQASGRAHHAARSGDHEAAAKWRRRAAEWRDLALELWPDIPVRSAGAD